ncbi:nucleotide exchange factor GrpE [Rhodococcus spelaei]|uniref:Protein GrpE n=1 Tax=Rhodococcus spelaei TaxID=2546320 RepID=A0A541BA92_9NOCA|nr:nucleotide exchange factor GrpE [Rhodococcus spelaei]TQF69250.1 nucleotide exchange factor GrpE [Rhodococcus spelaei]
MTAENPDREPADAPAADADTTPAAADAAAGAAAEIEVDELAKAIVERDQAVKDLGYAKADHANDLRKFKIRQAEAVDAAKVAIVTKFLDVADDLDRARAHGDLETGPLKALSDKLSGVFEGIGLVAFGEEGDVFAPDLHEAVQMEGDGHHPVLGAVLRKGYRLGDRVLRHAMVTVTDVEPASPESEQ